MARKNLARTAIEGGRANYCRIMERFNTRKERQHVRRELGRIMQNDEYADNMSLKRRQTYEISFSDKLNPVRRWIAKQVGKPWSETHSLICKKFNGNTLAGRHILGHIKSDVNTFREPAVYRVYYCLHGVRKSESTHHRYDYDIDDAGILQVAPKRPYYRELNPCAQCDEQARLWKEEREQRKILEKMEANIK